MAKQSGLHQIRGKVGEHSYYRQSGVVPGLIRGINPGMSSRVKTGDEYANTRLNNAEFRNAAELASAMGGIIKPKYRPMILPFSQSKLTKSYLALIKETDGLWGQRNAVQSQVQRIADHLNALAKRAYADMFLDLSAIVIPSGSSAGSVTVGWSGDQAATLASLGIDGVTFKVTPVRLLVGEYDSEIGRNRATFATLGESQTTTISVETGQEESEVISVPAASAVTPGFVPMIFAIVVAMPYRSVGERAYTLQEYCSFKCAPMSFAV